MLIYDLSPELLYSILEFLPTRYLRTVSRVCRKWRAVSAPLLYHTINLIDDKRATKFVGLIINKSDRGEGQSEGDDNVALHFVISVRRLHIRTFLNDEELGDLRNAILKLTSLEHLHWDVRPSDNLGHRVIVLPKNLSKLRSLSLVLNKGKFLVPDLEEDEGLTNLRELSVQFHQTKSWDRGPAQLFLNMIHGAFNLESLSIIFPKETDFNHKSINFFSALSQYHFPELRQFRSRSYHLVPNSDFDKFILRQFLQSNTRLHTIMIEASSDVRLGEPQEYTGLAVAPKEITELMPAVRHFAGPCYLVEALLRSTLADQLEELTLTESRTATLGSLKDYLPFIKDSNSVLPRLKRLRIKSTSVGWNDIFIFLAQFAWRVPELEDLDVGGQSTLDHNSGVSDCCLQALNRFPRLRTLSLDESLFTVVNANTGEDNQRFFMSAAEMCPCLDSVHFFSSGDWSGYWEIMRQHGRPADVVYMRWHFTRVPNGWTACWIDCSTSKTPVTRWHLHLKLF